MNKTLWSSLLIFQLFVQTANAFDYDMPPPPTKGSDAELRDFSVLHQYQNERSDVQCKTANLQSVPTVENMFGPQLGILTATEFQSVAVLGQTVADKVTSITDVFKNKFQRTRPYLVDSTLHPCVSEPNNGYRSYPSSHAAIGLAIALVFAKKFPAKRDAILKQGYQIGVNRLIGGVHHPSDVVAGQTIGRQIANDMMEIQ
jgi:acid phosphatase (class A)